MTFERKRLFGAVEKYAERKKNKLVMRKAVLYLLLVIFLVSCGPRRMKCGPGRRCLVDAPKEKMIVNKPIS